MIPVSNLPYPVQIQAKTTGHDDIGMPIETWETVATIQADIQPLGGELAQKEYGIVETGITSRMFCNQNDAVQLARRVVHDGNAYEVRHVAGYRGHMEVLLRPVI